MEHLTPLEALTLALTTFLCVLLVRVTLHVLVKQRLLAPRVGRLAVGALTIGVVLLACSVALAQEGAPPVTPPSPVTGYPLIDRVLAWLGATVTVLSTLAAILPKSWRVTQLIARFSADLRGILTPDPSDDPAWAKSTRDKSHLMIVLCASLVLPGCAWFRDTVQPVAVECAPGKQYIIEGLSEILSGANAFDVLNRIKDEKGPELVLCALERFLDRVAVSPETEVQRRRARAYLDQR
jgi:hypothetical protein